MHPSKRSLGKVCEHYCEYYKPAAAGKSDRDDDACQGLIALYKLFNSGLTFEIITDFQEIHADIDAIIYRRVCSKCAWLEADCDYRDPGAAGKAKPCGGVLLLSGLLISGEINEDDLE